MIFIFCFASMYAAAIAASLAFTAALLEPNVFPFASVLFKRETHFPSINNEKRNPHNPFPFLNTPLPVAIMFLPSYVKIAIQFFTMERRIKMV